MARRTVTDDGGWCWFQDPRAVRHHGQHDRTYVGWITRHGDVAVGQYDHETGTITKKTLHEDYERDDHDDPTFAVRPDGRLIVFYTRHGGPEVNYRISEAPEDISAFGSERRIEPGGPDRSLTYPNPRWLQGDLHLFLRNDGGGLGRIVCVVSADGGESWGGQHSILTTGEEGWCVYHKLSRAREGEVHLGLTRAMGGGHEPHRHLHHARFDGDALRATDGSVLGHLEDSLPAVFDDATTVFDSDATGDDAWIWDCAAPDGRPQVAYAQLVSETDHRYRYAHWDGKAWQDELLCHGGEHIVSGADNLETYYSGGVVLDHDEAGVCYASVGSHEGSALRRFERVDENGEGASAWRQTTIAPDGEQNVRPMAPWNAHPDLQVCWLRGEYTTFNPTFSDDDGAAFWTAVVGDGGE